MLSSLRSRLVFGVVGVTMLVLAASSVSVYALMHASLFAEFDSAVAAKAKAIAAAVECEGEQLDEQVSIDAVPEPARTAVLERAAGAAIREIRLTEKEGRAFYEVKLGSDTVEPAFRIDAADEHPRRARIEFEIEEGSFPEFSRAKRPEYLELWRADGDVIYRSPSLEGRDLAADTRALEKPRFRATGLPDGRRGRAVSIRFAPRQERPGAGPVADVVLVIARDTRDVDRALARLRLLLVCVCAAATAVSAGVLAWTVRRGLRPVDELARQIGAVRENDLSARVALTNPPSELAPVVDRLNELLSRLEAAFNRERTASADIAHELRTPLAGLRTTLEVALSDRSDSNSLEEALSDSFAVCCQMHALVENLLAMARSEAGQLEVFREAVSLDEALAESWRTVRGAAAERGLRLHWLAEPCLLQTDREKLRLILQNILGNAVTYADADGYVKIESKCADGSVTLTVSNSGSKLDAEQAKHVFERFWRGDASRAETGLHCGLGLTLCENLTRLLGGTISAESEAGGEFTVRLSFRGRVP